jgi:hypothetical protein
MFHGVPEVAALPGKKSLHGRFVGKAVVGDYPAVLEHHDGRDRCIRYW